MNIGERVIIGISGNYEISYNPQYGTVIKSAKSKESYSHHGSPYYPMITVVEGDDGGTYNDELYSSYRFMSVTSFLSRIDEKIKDLQEEIQRLNKLSEKVEDDMKHY